MRTTEQRREPGFIQQHLLMGRLPERTNLLGLATSGKGLLLDCQRNELFEMLRFGVRAARLPLAHRPPGDAEPIGQA